MWALTKRCWNPLSLAGLQRGALLKVLLDPCNPKKIQFNGEQLLFFHSS
jgi:hypothetical protein